MKHIQGLHCCAILSTAILFTQPVQANLQFSHSSTELHLKQAYLSDINDDRFVDSKPSYSSLPAVFTATENNITSSLTAASSRTDDLSRNNTIKKHENWSITKITVPEPPSPLLFLAGIAIIGLVRLRSKTIH